VISSSAGVHRGQVHLRFDDRMGGPPRRAGFAPEAAPVQERAEVGTTEARAPAEARDMKFRLVSESNLCASIINPFD